MQVLNKAIFLYLLSLVFEGRRIYRSSFLYSHLSLPVSSSISNPWTTSSSEKFQNPYIHQKSVPGN